MTVSWYAIDRATAVFEQPSKLHALKEPVVS